jgi:hypothetical protein
MIQDYIKGIDDVNLMLRNFTRQEVIEMCIEYEMFEFLPRNIGGVCVYDGTLDIRASNIKKLPDNLTIHGDFYCDSNELTELPKKLRVDGYMNCSYNYLTTLPNDLVVDDDLYCISQKTNKQVIIPKTAKISGNIYN